MGPVIIGSTTDLHVAAVMAKLDRRPLVVDAETIAANRFTLFEDVLWLDGRQAVAPGVRGWIRRLSPEGWETGVTLGSHDAALKTAWLALIASVARIGQVQWLTPPAVLPAAEDKMLQYSVARRIGVPTPEAMVTSEVDRAVSAFGQRFIVKPLGPGHFFEDGEPRVVFAAVVEASTVERLLRTAPFIAQRHVRAVQHLRVVTVASQAWVAAAPAPGDAIDWRAVPHTHRGFVRTPKHVEVSRAAIRLAAEMGCGYTSQDWVVDEDGAWWFLDLNPGGQWLFLDPETADEVAIALAAWLSGDE